MNIARFYLFVSKAFASKAFVEEAKEAQAEVEVEEWKVHKIFDAQKEDHLEKQNQGGDLVCLM